MDIESRMDLAVGRFVREVTVLEVSLSLVAGAAHKDAEWVTRSLGSVADHVNSIRADLAEFPRHDQEELTAQLREAEWVWQFRRALVHGRWTLLDATSAEYVSERPLPKGEAKEYTERPGWASTYPEVSLRFNLESVTEAIQRMLSVQAYLDDNMDRWDTLFGVELDDDFSDSETARINSLRRNPRL